MHRNRSSLALALAVGAVLIAFQVVACQSAGSSSGERGAGGGTGAIGGQARDGMARNDQGMSTRGAPPGGRDGAGALAGPPGSAFSRGERSEPLFRVSGEAARIELSGVEIQAPSGLLLGVSTGRSADKGECGGTAVLVAEGQVLSGNVVADKASEVSILLREGSRWSGAVDEGRTAKAVALRLDETSSWTVTADSRVTTLEAMLGSDGKSIVNIRGDGHTVRYSSGANAWLLGKTYALAGGGCLRPY